MATEHVDITDPELHEPKGASTASVGMVYVANGAGSGTWKLLSHASCSYSNIGTGTTYTTPTIYTLINPTTTGDSAPIGFSHNSAGRLTYTGTASVDVTVTAYVTFKHSTGAGTDCYFALHKNGTLVTNGANVLTADSANYKSIPIVAHLSVVTNDYLELYCKTASGNIVVHSFVITAEGHQ